MLNESLTGPGASEMSKILLKPLGILQAWLLVPKHNEIQKSTIVSPENSIGHGN